MELTTNNRSKSTTFRIILVTVVVTAIVLISILYSFDLISAKEAPSVDIVTHTDGMVHSDDMNHDEAISERQQDVAERGLAVMPFELDRSTHIFEKTSFGGIQQVLSDDNDKAQIKLIQTHLEEEYGRFQNGDFADPTLIHGSEMPGLSALQLGFQDISLSYEPLINGGQISYSTTDEELIDAIHAWFDAQLADHGAHATTNE